MSRKKPTKNPKTQMKCVHKNAKKQQQQQQQTAFFAQLFADAKLSQEKGFLVRDWFFPCLFGASHGIFKVMGLRLSHLKRLRN